MSFIRKFLLAAGNFLDFRNVAAETIFGVVTFVVGISLLYAPVTGTVATVSQLTNRDIFAWALIVSGIIIALSTHITFLKPRSLETFALLSLPFAAFASISVVSYFLQLNRVSTPIASIVYLGFYFLTAKTIFEKNDKDKDII